MDSVTWATYHFEARRSRCGSMQSHQVHFQGELRSRRQTVVQAVEVQSRTLIVLPFHSQFFFDF
jgi:hypothetical protein